MFNRIVNNNSNTTTVVKEYVPYEKSITIENTPTSADLQYIDKFKNDIIQDMLRPVTNLLPSNSIGQVVLTTYYVEHNHENLISLGFKINGQNRYAKAVLSEKSFQDYNQFKDGLKKELLLNIAKEIINKNNELDMAIDELLIRCHGNFEDRVHDKSVKWGA